MPDKEAAHAYRLQQTAGFFEGAGLIYSLENGTWFKAAGTDTAQTDAMADLRQAYPRWTSRDLEKYRRNYEKAYEEHGGLPFDEHVRHTRDLRRGLRDQGVPVDAPPHPESQLVFEYDPPLPRCPNDCYEAGFWHMNAPNDLEARGRRRQDGLPGKRQCMSCLEVSEAPQVPGGRRRLLGVRLETHDEVPRRKEKEGWRLGHEPNYTRLTPKESMLCTGGAA